MEYEGKDAMITHEEQNGDGRAPDHQITRCPDVPISRSLRLHPPRLSPQPDLHSGAEGQRQGRESKSLVVLLASQTFAPGLPVEHRIQPITRPAIDLF